MCVDAGASERGFLARGLALGAGEVVKCVPGLRLRRLLRRGGAWPAKGVPTVYIPTHASYALT